MSISKRALAKFTLTTLAVLTLAACGSSGGSGGGSTSSNVKNTITETVANKLPNSVSSTTAKLVGNDATSKTEKKTEPEKDKITGYRYEGYDTFIPWSQDGQNINVLKVWGTEITLVDPSQTQENGWLKGANSKETGLTNKVIGGNLQDARYGVVINRDESVAFVQGKATDVNNIPTTGLAKYEGQHVINAENINAENKDVQKAKFGYQTGKAVIDVNFDNKTLTGALEIPQQGQSDYLAFSADISGNSFSNRSFGNNDIQVDGKFYGEHADEMAGIYRTEKKFSGAFGAKKVEKSEQPEK
ncbi:Slam-dependent surface lipoprotein [Haemophilus parahaemolyticus]